MIRAFFSKIISGPGKPFQVIPKTVSESWRDAVYWKPLQPTKRRMFNQRLDAQNFNRHRFKPGFKAFIGDLVFWVLLVIFLYTNKTLQQIDIEEIPNVVFIGLGLVLIFKIFRIIQAVTPVVFDKPSGFFWKGWQKPWNSSMSNKARLKDIMALQIIHKTVSSQKGSWTVYELNLLLKNKERLNVIDRSDPETLKEDALLLARFLNVPLWNAVKLEKEPSLF